MLSTRLIELKRKMNELVTETQLEHHSDPKDLRDEAVRNFEIAGAELLDQITPFLWAYYKQVAGQFDPDDRAEYGIPQLSASQDIWEQVELRRPPSLGVGGGKFQPGRSYLSWEGEVSWEPEHGLQLVFEEGNKLCKVGPYDGHYTNAHAYADEEFLGVVFT